jgi:hypothetical protein
MKVGKEIDGNSEKGWTEFRIFSGKFSRIKIHAKFATKNLDFSCRNSLLFFKKKKKVPAKISNENWDSF